MRLGSSIGKFDPDRTREPMSECARCGKDERFQIEWVMVRLKRDSRPSKPHL